MDSLYRLAAPQWTLLTDPARLRALSDCSIFATRPESQFDDIVRLAALACQTKSSLIAFADGEHLHFKSTFGANKPLLRQITDSFFIPTVQRRFFTWTSAEKHSSPITIDQSINSLHFYAGVPIRAREKHIIGVLCVTHPKSRKISTDQLDALLALGRQTEQQIALRQMISDQRDLIEDRDNEIETRRSSEARLASALSRESLINQIGKAARSTADPTTILKTAVSKLGNALAADRCYFVNYSPYDQLGTVSHDWCAPGFESIEGVYNKNDFDYNHEESYLSGLTFVNEDVLANRNKSGYELAASMGLRSILRAPILQDTRMTALCVGMATPRKWTADEITLVEVVAAQTRAAVETARHILHERALLRDVLASVTEGKLILTESQEQLPKKLMPYGDPVILDKSGGLDLLREKIRNACQTGNHSELRAFDLLTAASEAGMNAIVHAERGTANLSIDENGTIQVAIEDNGTGIAFDDLPKATLARGYSTKSTLGHGLKMILETIDRLYLLTGPGGTTVVMEQDKFEPQPFWLLQQKEK